MWKFSFPSEWLSRKASAKYAKLNQIRARTEAALRGFPRILSVMSWPTAHSRAVPSNIVLRSAFLFGALILGSAACHAQDAQQGPLTPPPDHKVRRIGTEPTPPAPPSMPPEEIIKRFSEKEDEYVAARAGYTYKKTIRLEEFGPDGNSRVS